MIRSYSLICALPLLVAFCLLQAVPTLASEINISDMFHYRQIDGMGSERVYSIVEGKDRAVWMGTRTGVERYNGSNFKHYDLSDNLQRGDYAGRVIKLFSFDGPDDGQSSAMPTGIGAFDNTGRIYYYSGLTDRFTIAFRLSDRFAGNILLNSVAQLADKSLLLALSSGLYRLKDNEVTPILTNANINAMSLYGNVACLATTDGVILLDISRKTVHNHALKGLNVQSVYYSHESSAIYAGGGDSGLWRINTASNSVAQLGANQPALLSPIRAIIPLDSHHLAVGVDGGGVYICDTRSNLVRKLVDTDDRQRFYLNGNGVYTLMLDSYGHLWTGSYTGGASSILFRPSAVTALVHEPGNSQSVRNNIINGIAENIDGNIWYATGSGISIFSPRTNSWSHSLNNNVIVTLAATKSGGMLAGTYGNGLLELDAAGNVVRNLTRSKGALTSNAIFSIYRTQSGEYWAASLDGGVMRLDPGLRLIRTYPIDVAFSITETAKGEIAVASANGFHVISPATHKINHYATSDQAENSDISCYITSLLFNNDGTVWCGTEGGGIFVYDLAKRRVGNTYRLQQGLPSNDVYSIQRDSKGRMIVSTSNGLALYTGSGFRSLNYFRGLAKEYNKSASTLLANGNMIFGSLHGADVIIPSKLTNVSYNAKINIRGLEVWDKATRANDGGSYDAEPIRFTPVQDGKVSLDYTDQSFTAYFEAINLQHQDDIAYQYMLEGYDRTWSTPSLEGKAEFKNLSPGGYILRVRSLRNSDGEVLDEASVRIDVAYPWWRSWWAWCIYIAVFSTVAFSLYRVYLLRLQKEHDDDKIRFFTNTAHDIRTPVSLVMAPITDLKNDDSLSPKARELVDISLNNIAKLSNITNQLLEFERFDSGKSRFVPKPVDISSLLKIEAECFRDAFNRKDISLYTSGLDTEVYISADTYLLEMLFDNLLSNAYKYTNSKGEVRLQMSADEKRVQIIVQDNGIGIPGADRKRVMREVYRARNARESQATGTGFGLLQVRRIVEMLGGRIRMHSREGVGTSFIISFGRIFPSSSNAEIEVLQQKKSTAYIDGAVLFDTLNSSATAEALQSSSGAHPASPAHDHTLLIVEDNDDLRRYLYDMFSAKYDVVATASAHQALDCLKTHYPDLILSDVMMPEMQGDELCRLIKSNPATAGIPVILLTAKADHLSVLEGLGMGADDYLAKPFNSDILRMKVNGMIANRDRMRQQLLSEAISIETLLETEPQVSVSSPSDTAVADTAGDKSEAETPTSPEAGDIENASDREFVERATQIVHSHMSNPDFDIDILCREMAMSRTLFFGRLKSLTGKAPQDFIRLLRMESAAELLRSGLSVAEVADRIGFTNVKYFSTVFKKYFGIQPSKFS